MRRWIAVLTLAAAGAALPGCLLVAAAALGAGIVHVTGEDSAEVVVERSPDAVYAAAREELRNRGVVETADATARTLEGKVGSSSVEIRVREESGGASSHVEVKSRHNGGVSPDPDTAQQVATAILKRAG